MEFDRGSGREVEGRETEGHCTERRKAKTRTTPVAWFPGVLKGRRSLHPKGKSVVLMKRDW